MSYSDDADDLREIFDKDLETTVSGYSEEILESPRKPATPSALPAKGEARRIPEKKPQPASPAKQQAAPPTSRKPAAPQAPPSKQASPARPQEPSKKAAPPAEPTKKKAASPRQSSTKSAPNAKPAPAQELPKPQESQPSAASKPPSDPLPVIKKPVKLRPPSHVEPHPHSTPDPKPEPAPTSKPVQTAPTTDLPEPTPAEDLLSLDEDELFPFDEATTPDFSEDAVLSFDSELDPPESFSLPPIGDPSPQSQEAKESLPSPKRNPVTPQPEPTAKPSPEPKQKEESQKDHLPAPVEEPQKRPASPAVYESSSDREEIAPPASLEKRAAIAAAAVTTSESGAEKPEPSSGEMLLRTEGLVKVYDGRTVVNGVEITVRKGEIVGLLGPNGAGKTTSFYMIVGLVPPNGGHVSFNDSDVTTMPMYQRARLGMGYLPQEESIFRKLTVEENIMAVMETLSIPRREKVERCNELLERFSITHIRKNVALTCSGGEKRRLTIARSLVTEPSLLMLDEPFSGVDPIAVNEIQTIVEDLRKSGLAILITDHNARQTLELVDRAYLIYEGRVLREGSRDFLINDPVSRELYLGDRFTM
ncbi:MAG: LPS export ABC transporter ATP-binding protein [Verrucomicrobiales bacterium]|nr:LPS export ABC transporter ATP-binding protein [Verrucomicrobiales bacterium]